jgi:electron transfer flavoprotein alpha subunit
MISDILSVDAAGEVFERPIYAGNAVLKVKVAGKPGKVKVITVRTTAFDKAEVADTEQSIEVEEVAAEEKEVPTSFAGEELTTSSRPDLSSASRVVSGGRALKSQEQFNQIMEPLADSLGAGGQEWPPELPFLDELTLYYNLPLL